MILLFFLKASVLVAGTFWALSLGIKLWRRSYIGKNHLMDCLMILLEQIVFGSATERAFYQRLAKRIIRLWVGPPLTPEQMLEKIKQQKKG